MTGQMQIFEPGATLLDATLEQRQAAAELLLQEPTSLDERVELLVLVCWPAVWRAEQ